MPGLVIDIALGFAIGLTLGFLGGGGSILTVPALVYIVGSVVLSIAALLAGLSATRAVLP